MTALMKAKEALIGYAVSYPDSPKFEDIDAGPGFLPCPDSDGDGIPNTVTASDCGSKTVSPPVYAVGRLPWVEVGLEDLRDGSGERLWYSVSNKYRNRSPKDFPLNSDSQGELTLDGTGDVVAIVISPGSPVCSQNRLSANKNNEIHYLEDVNQDSNPDFITSGTTVSCNDEIKFNDTVIAITRRELMAAVEKRVIGEVANVLTQHRNVLDNLTPITLDDGRFPWLSPFADPREIISTGKAETDSITELTDTSKDFVTLGVRAGDLVQNTTDSSSGIITAVTSNILTANLFGGTKNFFSVNDDYRVPRLNGSGVGIYPPSLTPLDSGVREGHLSSHDQNEAFRTIFIANWTINGASETICSQLDPTLSGDHVTDLQNNLLSGSLTAAIDQGICVWTTEEEVNCSMFIEPYSITSALPDTSSTPLCDPAAPFKADIEIVKRTYKFQFIGDVNNINTKIKNLNGELTRDVSTTLALPFVLTIQDLDSTNEIVGEAVATTSGVQTGSIDMTNIFYDLADISGLVAAGSSGTQLIDTSKDFILRGVQPGDWVENTNNNTRGRVVSTDLSNPDTLTLESKGTTALSFTTGDRYKIYQNLPVWFTQNNWHHLYYVAESSEEVPGGSGTCATGGTNCIVINGLTINGASPPKHNQAVVISAGSPITSASLTQDRTLALLSEYFEAENLSINDDIFTIFSPPQTQAFPPQLNLFNDQIRIVRP